jgi:branched-chain amino acid transport system ATP-binding protein
LESDVSGGSPLLEIVDLHVAYGRLEVVHGVSLTVAPGTFTVLLGRNGAGKTTTLRAVSGLIRKRAGVVRFGGVDITRASPAIILQGGLVQVLDGHRVFTSLSVDDNLQVSMFGSGQRRDASTVDSIYDLFPELAQRRWQPASRLSGGQQQILAVAQGLVAKPRLLILDEPSAGLAPLVVDRILKLAKTLTEQGTAILLVEQFVKKALAYADYCYILDHGSLVGAGRPDKLQDSGIIHRVYLGGGSGAAVAQI